MPGHPNLDQIWVTSELLTIHSKCKFNRLSACKVKSKMSGLNRVIANRLLTCLIDGHQQEVQVNLGEPFEDNGAFTCPFEIVIGTQSTILGITGIDGVQALQLALFMVGSSLRSMSYASNWRWANEAGSGFPSTLKEPLFGEGNELPPTRQ